MIETYDHPGSVPDPLLESACAELDRLWRSGTPAAMARRRALHAEVLAALWQHRGEYRTAEGVALVVNAEGDGFLRDDPSSRGDGRLPPALLESARRANRRRFGP
jgi:hypothetical protein